MSNVGWWFLMLAVTASATRLIGLSWPPEVVFDEVHFGKFVSAYCCTHERFFDIHPPHAKLLIAGAVSLTRYDGGFSFENIGQKYGDISPLAFRIIPALAGVLLPLIIFGLLLQLGVSKGGSFMGGLAIALDNALIVQSRVIALDGILLAAIFSALLFVLLMREAKGEYRWLLAVLAGAAAGLAAGAKFTGLAALGLVGLVMLADLGRFLYRRHSKRAGQQVLLGLVVLVSFAVIYLAGWWIHFTVLTRPGPGDAWRIPSQPFLTEVVEWQRMMLNANYGLTAGHPDASPWWSWPLMLRPVFYWQGQGGSIQMIGNPAVWWGSMVFLPAALVFAAATKFKFLARGRWTLAVGFAASLLPLMGVPRALFIYHYFTSLVFAVCLGAVFLDTLAMKLRRDTARRLTAALVLVLLTAWLVTAPMTYGLPTPSYWQEILNQLPRF